MLHDHDVEFDNISIVGGEPFLHSDILSYIHGFKEIKYHATLSLTTNGFWISPSALSRYSMVFESIDVLNFSFYTRIVNRVGGDSYFHDYIYLLGEKYPDLVINIAYTYVFNAWALGSRPMPDPNNCWWNECLALDVNGLISRCGVARSAEVHPHVTNQFIENRHQMIYDLNYGTKDFFRWYNLFPYSSCFYCSSRRGGALTDWGRVDSDLDDSPNGV